MLAISRSNSLPDSRWGLKSKSLYHKDLTLRDETPLKSGNSWRHDCAMYWHPEESWRWLTICPIK